MKKSRILSAILAGAMTLSTFSGFVFAADNATMSIDVDTVIKSQPASVYGFGTDYMTVKEADSFAQPNAEGTVTYNPLMKSAMNTFGVPFVRFGGVGSQAVDWKGTVGPYAERSEFTLWGQTDKVAGSIPDQFAAFRDIDENAEFGVTISLNDTAENVADLVEFLEGDASTEWGAKRIEYGYTEPFAVKVYEIGNEQDLGGMAVADYIAKAETLIDAIHSVNADAKIAMFGSTSMYVGERDGGEHADWEAWHRAILADDVAEKIDYIAIHTYYDTTNANVMDRIFDTISEDIDNCANKDIKIYISEHALAIYNDTNPHNMAGVLQTANVLSRTMWQDKVEIAATHGIWSNDWAIIAYDHIEKNRMSLNTLGHTEKLFKEYGVGDVLDTTFTGFEKGVNSSVTGVAVKEADGSINFIFTNKTGSALPVKLNFSDNAEYQLVEEAKIVGNSLTAEFDYYGTETKDTAKAYYTTFANPAVVSTYNVPAYSVTAIKVTKKADVDKTSFYANDFSEAEDYEVFGIEADSDGYAEVADGKLVLNGGEDYNLDYGYVYLPYYNENEAFRLDMDVAVSSISDPYCENGIVLNSSVNDDEFTDGNVIKFAGDFAEEIQYTDGEMETLVSASEDGWTDGYMAHYTVDVKADGTVTFYIDNVEVFSRTGGLKNAAGYIGFLFSDTVYSVDNVEISKYDVQEIETTTMEEIFKYEENFDSYEDGEIPEGFVPSTSMITAHVEDGALIVDSQTWWEKDMLMFTNLGNVLRKGLTMEMDVTVLSEIGRQNSVDNRVGFGYAATNHDFAYGFMRTYNPQIAVAEYGVSNVKAPTGGYGTINADFTNAEAEDRTANFKIVCGGGAPDVFVDGTRINYSKPATVTGTEGAIGIAITGTKVRIDNLKVTGIKKKAVESAKLVEKVVDFTYEQDFEDVANGTLPIGWYTYGSMSASVEDGVLKLEASNWYDDPASWIFFEDIGEVHREGLTIEMDFKRTGNPFGSVNSGNSKAAIALNGKLSNGELLDAGYVALHTDSFTDQEGSQKGTTRGSIKQTSLVGAANWAFNNTLLEGYKQMYTGETQNLKITYQDVQLIRSPKVYVNGVEASFRYPEWENATTDWPDTGFVGIMGTNSRFSVDNVKISGKKTIWVVDDSTYDAFFTTEDTLFASEAAAKAAVKVMATTPDGDVSDVTKDATFEVTTDEQNNCTIVVSYGGKEVKTLTCTLMAKVLWDFVYEVDFDDLADGTLPEGWVLYNHPGAHGSTSTAKVVDGALVFDGNGEWNGEESYLVFENLGDVERTGLKFEFDVKKTGAHECDGNIGNSNAGFIWNATVADGAVTDTAKAILYTENTSFAEKFQRIKAFETNPDSSTDFNVADLGGANLRDGGTVNVKADFALSNRSAAFKINDIDPTGYHMWEGWPDSQGKIGLTVLNTEVTFDNIKISGKRYVPVTEAVTYAAKFGSSYNVYESIEEATADIVATKNSYEDGLKTITPSCDFETTLDGEDLTIAVKYEGKVIATLICKVIPPVAKTFVYEENFDSYADGTVPEGYVLYNHSGADGQSSSVKVQDGALIFDCNGVWNGEESYLAFENLGQVRRAGLTVEMDITRVGGVKWSGNAGNSNAGFFAKGSSVDGVFTADEAVLYTEKDADAPQSQQGRVWEYDAASGSGFSKKADDTTVNLKNGGTFTLKLVYSATNRSPFIYLNGIEVNNAYPYWGSYDGKGFIGLTALNTEVKIDNIKITGTLEAGASEEGSVAVNSTKAADGKVYVSASAEKLNDANAMFVAAVYEKDTEKLVATSAVKALTTDLMTTTFEVDAPNYSADTHVVKIMAMGTDLTPVAVNAEF